LPVATRRTDGSAKEVESWYAVSETYSVSTEKLNTTMMTTMVRTLLSLAQDASGPSHAPLSVPSLDRSLMKAPPRKTHTSENCVAMARVLMSLRLYGCTNWINDR